MEMSASLFFSGVGREGLLASMTLLLTGAALSPINSGNSLFIS